MNANQHQQQQQPTNDEVKQVVENHGKLLTTLLRDQYSRR